MRQDSPESFAELHRLACRDYRKNNSVSRGSARNASFLALILNKAMPSNIQLYLNSLKNLLFFFSISNNNIIVFKMMVNSVVEIIKCITTIALMSLHKVL